MRRKTPEIPRPTLHPGEGRRIVAQNIRRLRKEKGIAQEELAALGDVDRSYMGRVERGEINISVDNIFKVAEALEVDVRELFAPLPPDTSPAKTKTKPTRAKTEVAR